MPSHGAIDPNLDAAYPLAVQSRDELPEGDEKSRLENKGSVLKKLWDARGASIDARAVDIIPGASKDFGNHRAYGLHGWMNDAEYYTVYAREDPNDEPHIPIRVIGPESPAKKEKLEKAWRAYCSCTASSVVLERIAQELFAGDPSVTKVECFNVDETQPRILLFWDTDLDAVDDIETLTVYKHHIFRVYTRGGRSYIIDPSGIQFGYDKWFFTLEEYQRDHVRPGSDLIPHDIAAHVEYLVAEAPHADETVNVHDREESRRLGAREVLFERELAERVLCGVHNMWSTQLSMPASAYRSESFTLGNFRYFPDKDIREAYDKAASLYRRSLMEAQVYAREHEHAGEKYPADCKAWWVSSHLHSIYSNFN